MDTKADFHFRYILIGESEVGKSSLLLQFTEKSFHKDTECTLGVEMGGKDITLGDKTAHLEIWDTAGQEVYLSLTRSYYRGADGCLLIYDITNRKSFEALSMWLSEARTHSNNPNLVVMMVGNKCDLHLRREVSMKEAQAFADANDLIFIEATATQYEAAESAFIKTAEAIYTIVQTHGRAKSSGMRLDNNGSAGKSKSSSTPCCK